LVTSTVIYLFVSLTAVGLIGYSDLSSTGSPLVEAIKVTGSQAAVSLIAMGAMVATNSVLLTTILGVSRVTFAMARNNDFPMFLSRIHPKYETPYYAIWITGLLMVLAIVFADLTRVVAVSTFASLIYYLIANFAALRLRGKVRRYS
jgi:APA family basic amino acid/polyamine antiporter